MVLLFLRMRMSSRSVMAYVGNRKTTNHAQASSDEAVISDRVKKANSVQAAELVGETLAERMKRKQITRAKFDPEAEFVEKPFKFHSHVIAITKTLQEKGIMLIRTSR